MPPKLPPNDPLAWTTILTQMFGPKVVEPVMNLAWTPEVAVALFRKEANEMLVGKMVPDSGVPDVNTPEAGIVRRRPHVGRHQGHAPGPRGRRGQHHPGHRRGDTGTEPAQLLRDQRRVGRHGRQPGRPGRRRRQVRGTGGGGGRGRPRLEGVPQRRGRGGHPGLNAKDRIGAGPWRNQKRSDDRRQRRRPDRHASGSQPDDRREGRPPSRSTGTRCSPAPGPTARCTPGAPAPAGRRPPGWRSRASPPTPIPPSGSRRTCRAAPRRRWRRTATRAALLLRHHALGA